MTAVFVWFRVTRSAGECAFCAQLLLHALSGMDRMTSGARSRFPRSWGMVGLLRSVAGRTRLLSRGLNIVSVMTVGANTVLLHLRRTYGRVILMAAFARIGGRGAQIMSGVTARALLVTASEGCGLMYLWRSFDLMTLMTGSACLFGDFGWTVWCVTVETGRYD